MEPEKQLQLRIRKQNINIQAKRLNLRQVTQRFFDAVSTQLERWYERKVAEVEREAEVRGRRDREELQQQLEELEEELRRLKTNGKAET